MKINFFDGEKLKKLRKSKGYSLDKLQLELYKKGFLTTKQTIKTWESKTRSPSFTGVVFLSSVFDKDLSFFAEEKPKAQGYTEIIRKI